MTVASLLMSLHPICPFNQLKQHGRHLADCIFKIHFPESMVFHLVSNVIVNFSQWSKLVQKTGCCRNVHKLLSSLMMS